MSPKQQEIMNTFDCMIAAADLLKRLESMTPDEFSIGSDRKEREALQLALNNWMRLRLRQRTAA